MKPTYTIEEIKRLMLSLDLTGIDSLKKLLLQEKEFFPRKELKTIFSALDERIIWIKKSRAEWKSEFCGN